MINFALKWQKLPSYDFAVWDYWVNTQKTGTWFHTLRAFNLVFQTQPEILILKKMSGEWIAGFPFVRATKFGLTYPKRNPLLYFSSPVIHDNYLTQFDEIIKSLNRHFSFAIYDFPYLQTSYRDVSKVGKEQFGYWLDIQPSQSEQIDMMSPSHQKFVRKELKGSLEIKKTCDLTKMEIELANLSYQDHHKKSPFKTEEIEKMFKNLQSNESCVVTYSDMNQLLGWRCYIKDKKGHWIDWLAGTKRGVTKERFGQQLILFATEKARNEMVGHFDLTGGNTQGIAEFKEKFGSVKTFGLHLRYSNNFLISWILFLKDRLF